MDALRGLAVLGVLVAYTMWNLGSPSSETYHALDRVIDATLEMLVDAKFLTILTFLFGAGTAQQLRRVESSGHGVRSFHLRRMAFLVMVGIAHALVLRNGDVLAPYAFLGMGLLAARHWRGRAIALTAIVMAVAPYAIQFACDAAGWTLASRPVGTVPDNSWRHYWADNFEWFSYWYRTGPLVSWPRMLALMLLGVLAQRQGYLERLASDRPLARRLLLMALPIAIVGRVAVIVLPKVLNAAGDPLWRTAVLNQTYWISAWGLAATYVGALALLFQRDTWYQRLSWLSALGRMAFTNYVMQAAVVVPVCIAFGLFDAVTPVRGVVLAALVAAVQIPATLWWLQRHAYGPLEWAWRVAAYGTPLPIARRR